MKKLGLVAAVLVAITWSANGAKESSLDWDRLPDLPDAEGFAGVFAGVAKNNNQGKEFLVVAGGANFPNGRPWEKEKDPVKIYYDRVFTLELDPDAKGVKRGAKWEVKATVLPHEVGYGMSVSLPKRGNCLFIGGKHEAAFDDVWEVSFVGTNEIFFSPRPKLPVALAEGVAGLVGDKVVVVGGVTNKEGGGFETEQRAFVMDVSGNDGEWKWEELPWPQTDEGRPARGRAYAVSGVRDDMFYLFGGRDYADSGEPAPERVHQEKLDLLADCYVIDLKAEKPSWKSIASMPLGMGAAPSASLPVGKSHFLMLGGVSAPYWRKQFDDRPALNGAGEAHPGFESTIWAYDAITDTWAKAGDLPKSIGDVPTHVPVTTPVVFWEDRFIIPTGEIKPGIRSPQVLIAKQQEIKASLGIINWLVIGIYLSAMVGVGYWFMKRESASTTEAYFRGGQKIPYWVAGLSIFATVLSSITFMSIPARAYATDITWYVGQLAMLIIIPIVAFCYLPFFRKLDLTSAYLYLERRFNLAVRLFGSLSFIVLHVGRVAIVLYLPAVALAAVSNVDVSVAIIIIGVLCVVYTVMGGIEAVVWTDAIQAIVLMGGAVLCLLLVVLKVDGGVGGIMEIANNDEKLLQNLTMDFNIANGTTTVFVLFIAFFFNSFLQYTSGQDVIQRYVTTKDVASARKSMWTTMWMSVFGSIIFFLLGTALYAFYKSQPELLDPAMKSTDGILPFFIMQQLPAGVAGLIIAAVFAASQSSISSSLNSVATAWTKDFDARLIRPQATDGQYLFSAKIVVVIVGVLGIGVAIFMARMNIENAFKTFLGIVGLSSGSLGGVFALGVFTKRGNGAGALLGAVAGIAAVAWVKFSGAEVAGILYAFIGFTTCLIVGYLASFVVGGEGKQDEALSIHG